MKKLSTSFIFILAFLMLGSTGLTGQTVADQPPGDGSAANPWNVSTLAHLKWISENDNIGADTIIISADIDAAETRYWNDGKGYHPIDLANTNFIGIIDGQGHVIRNLYINRPTTDYIGFVSRVRSVDAVIMNLGMENCNFIGEDRVGAIAGDLDGIIENCYSTGKIVSVSYPGGIAGFLNGNGTILRCYSQVDLTVLDRRAGGLCSENTLDSIAFCYTTGMISGSTEDVGGFVGRAADENSPSKTRDNYWDVDRSGYANSSPDPGLVFAQGLSTADMKKQASFVNWDFANVWSIVEGKTYPFLKWQEIILQNEHPIKGTNSTRLGAGYVFNNASTGATISSYGYIYGIDSLPWWTGTDFSHGTKISEVTGAALAGGSGADIAGGLLPKVEKGKILYAVAYAISSDGTVAFGNIVEVAPPLLSDGSGTEADPWQISTLEQLNAINIDLELLDDYFILMNDIDAAPTKDWNAGAGWKPVDGFAGTFDGKGFDIMNLYIDFDDDYAGLFGRVDESSAVIKNLGVIDADVTGVEYVGVLVGRIEDGAVARNCYTSGVVKGEVSVGGLTGRVNGDGYIYSSYTTASVYSSGERAGGFAGANFVGSSVEAIIQDCYSTGAVYGAERVGGFIGNYLTGQIFSSYSTGMTLGEDAVGAFVGLFSADSASKIENSYYDTTLVPLMPLGFNDEDLNDHIPDYYILEIEGLTTAEMKNAASFTDWDFSDVWNIKEGVSRPYLDITDVMIIGEIPVVTNQLVEASAELHNIAAADITEAGFIFRSPDLSWSQKVADASFTGPVAIDGSATISVAFDDVLEAGKYFSVQSYATDVNGKNYYGDATFVFIEQEVYDATIVVQNELDAVVQGATVTIDGTAVTTDVNGEAIFADLVAGMRIPVKVENAGYPDLLTSLLISDDASVILSLSMNTYTLDVTVTDTAGTALAGVNVEIVGGTSAVSDVAGQVSFASVTEAVGVMYGLSLSGYVTATDTLNVTENRTVTLEMEPRSITVEVLDDEGMPVENAMVTITDLGALTTDADGMVQYMGVDPVAEATLEIVADSFNIFSESGEITNESLEISVELIPTVVRFILTDETGAPMSGAEIVLGLDTLETEEWGYVDFARVPSGVDVAYKADKFGYAPVTGNVNLSNANDTIELPMSRNLFNFTFTVTSGGAPVGGAEVLITGLDPFTTAADGTVRFENLPIGDHPYTVSKGLLYEVFSGTLSVVDQDGNVDVSLTALTYSVTIIVTDGSSNALEGAIVTLSGYGLATSGADGNAVFTGVVPANNIVYSVALSGYEDLINVLNVIDADVTISAGLTAIPYGVTLAIADKDGNAVEGATVSIAGMSDQTSDASGNVVLSGLEGTVSYTVAKAGFEDATGELTFSDKDQTVTVTLTAVVGVEEAAYTAFDVYPNPAANFVTIDLKTGAGRLVVYNITGKTVVNRLITSNQVSLDLSAIQSGLYFVKVWDAQEQLLGIEKMVIQK